MDLLSTLMVMDRRVFLLYQQCIFKLLNNHGIHPHQPALLRNLREEDCSQSELAKRLQVSPAAVAVSIRRMERNGIVERRQDPEDQRSNLVSLTAKGREIVQFADVQFRQIYEHKLAGFSGDEKKQMLGFLQRIAQNLETYKEEL